MILLDIFAVNMDTILTSSDLVWPQHVHEPRLTTFGSTLAPASKPCFQIPQFLEELLHDGLKS